MNAKELLDYLKLLEAHQHTSFDLEKVDVVIKAKMHPEGKLGGMDVCRVRSCARGIDWDINKFILFPEEGLKGERNVV